MRTRGLWVVLALVTGCHGGDPPAPGGAGSGSGSAVVAASGRPPGFVDLFVDGVSVGRVSPQQIAEWPRLDTLLPVAARRLGTWQDLYLGGKTAKPSEVHQPSATYPDLVPALFPGPDGAPAFGMFDPVELAKHNKPALEEDAIHEIRIKLALSSGRGEHEQGQGGGSDPTKLKLTVKTAKGEKVIEGKELLALPRQPMPGDDSKEPKGWPLTTILQTAGVTSYQRLVLSDAAGMNLTLEKVDFDPKTSIPFIKLNRQGQLRFRVFKKQGTGWQATGDLRSLETIEIVK